ncbi:MAG TPA: PAS domain S-box protein [Clostridia bacterium]|nr:PAS domain S-box protein [Clostridia bacterium]
MSFSTMALALRILHLEDEALDSELALEILRADGLAAEIDRVDTIEAFRLTLAKNCYPLILLDYTIPGVNPLQALKLAREQCPETAVIFLSGTIGEERAIDALKLGASDFVLKQHLERLVPAVRRALREVEEHVARKQAETALRKSEERLNGIISSAMDAIITVNTERRIVLFNPAAVSIFGIPQREALGQSIDRFIPERSRAVHASHVQEFGRTGATRRRMGAWSNLHGLRANGEEFPIEASISQVEVEGETLFTIIVRDITERKKAEEQLRVQSAALQSAANAISITDREGVICWANPAFERLTGYTTGEIVGQTHQLVKSGKQDASFYKNLWDTINAGQVWQGELVNRRKDGSLYHEEMTITPVRDDRGKITHFIAVKQDITERKQTEAALAESRQNLERTVAERTAQLVEANTNLQTFAYSAAHDLRSPLRAIKTFSTIISEDYGNQLNPEVCSLFDRINRSVGQMAQLLNDLLEYSKLSQADIRLEPVDLSKAVTEALALLESESRSKHAEIEVQNALPLVIGHPATVMLILTNILSNALKFVAPGVPPRIRLWAQSVRNTSAGQPPGGVLDEQAAEDGSKFVRLWVEDNGIGFGPEEAQKLFGVFQRLHGKHEYPGTGLGLAIVLRGAERMGGRVGVESEPGNGSRFWIELKEAA